MEEAEFSKVAFGFIVVGIAAINLLFLLKDADWLKKTAQNFFQDKLLRGVVKEAWSSVEVYGTDLFPCDAIVNHAIVEINGNSREFTGIWCKKFAPGMRVAIRSDWLVGAVDGWPEESEDQESTIVFIT
ncbi:MAG TPA: hypothetical protein VF817_03120 [Patescibacteria group bacterium]